MKNSDEERIVLYSLIQRVGGWWKPI